MYWPLLIFLESFRTLFNIPNTAFSHLLAFLPVFLTAFIRSVAGYKEDIPSFPKTLYLFEKAIDFLKKEETGIVRYVMCPLCATRYEEGEVVRTMREKQETQFCCSRHLIAQTTLSKSKKHNRSARKRDGKLCGTRLTKVNRSGEVRPLLVFPYLPVLISLKRLLCERWIRDALDHWTRREVPEGVLSDIYDGRMWKNFKDRDGQKFFSGPERLGFILNVDWFQPYTHSQVRLHCRFDYT